MNVTRDAAATAAAAWAETFARYAPLRIRYAGGEMISQAGSYVAGVHLIVHGAVSEKAVSDGPPCAAVLLGPGDFVGLECLFHGCEGLARTQVRAVTGVELLFLETKRFSDAMNDDSMRLRTLMEYLARRCLCAQEEHPWGQRSGEARIARLLVRLAVVCGCPAEEDSGWVRLPPDVSPRVLCDLAAISSRQWRQIRQALEGCRVTAEGIEFRNRDLESVYSVSSMIER